MIHFTSKKGFSLIEILVAMTVLSILALMLSEMTRSTQRTTEQSSRGIDAATQARTLFDRIGEDIANMVVRDDIDYVFQNVDTTSSYEDTDLLRFVTQLPAPNEVGSANLENYNFNRRISLVAYRVGQDSVGRPVVTRGTLPIYQPVDPLKSQADALKHFMGINENGTPNDLTDDTVFPLPTIPADFAPGATFYSNKYDIVGPGVFRMEVGFQLKSTGELAETVTTPVNINDISSIAVSIAVINERNIRIINNPTDLEAVANNFAPFNPSAGDKHPLEPWVDYMNTNPTTYGGSLRPTVQESIKVYQRFFRIPHNH